MAHSIQKLEKMSSKMVVVLISIFLFMTPAEAFFRHLCFNPLGFGRVDPIVSPGKASQHLHHLHGSGNLGIDSVDADYLLEANCTSCSITLDKSGYWAPAMYFQHENGTFELMSTSGGITVYYKTEKRVNFLNQNYTVFPNNLRMVAGNSSKRHWIGPWPIRAQSLWTGDEITQDSLASKALGFNCLNYGGTAEATFAYSYLRSKDFIDANCPQGVRAEILFPSCWDGVNLDSPDHKSHVAYPQLLQDGACPDTHSVYLPILFYETIWNTQQFTGVPGQFVFSNGDPTGYGYHGDFLAAWEEGVLEQVMAHPNCTDQDIYHRHVDGLQEHCPVFEGHLQSPDEAAQCTLEVPENLAHDKIIGSGAIQTMLPGNMQVTGQRHNPGDEADDFDVTSAPAAASSSASMPVETLASSIVPVTSSDRTESTSLALSPVTDDSPPAPTAADSIVVTDNLSFVTLTSSYTSGGVFYEVEVVEQIVVVTSTFVPTDTTTTTASTNHNHTHRRKHHDFI